MRRAAALLALTLAALAAPRGLGAATIASIEVRAAAVDFYYDHFAVIADGDVRVRLSDGTTITGDTFAMNLKMNRYLIAGKVHVTGRRIDRTGAAWAGYLDTDRSYLLTDSDAPDRLTYFGLDWSDGHPGREQPGDAFTFVDVGGERSYVTAPEARIYPLSSVVFDHPRVQAVGIVKVPLPRYVVTFAANPHFVENAFAGGQYDVALPTNASATSLTAFHIRSDQTAGTHLAFDQHLVWDRDWVVGSMNPVNQDQRQLNVIGLKAVSPAIQIRGFAQESALQYGSPFVLPTVAAGFFQTQVNIGLRGSGLSLTNDFFYNSLLAPQLQYDTAGSHHHAVDGLLTWNGFERRIPLTKTLALNYRLRSGIGYAHDQFGEGGYLNLDPSPPDLWYKFGGITLSIPDLHPLKGYTLSLTSDHQITLLPAPHKTAVDTEQATLSHHLARADVYVAYTVTGTRDLWGDEQSAAYPAASDTLTTPFGTYSGQSAFRGLSTARQLSLGSVIPASRVTTFSLTLQRNYDAPAPVPGAYGQPPVQATFALTTRFSKRFRVSVSRQYYFNFANLVWAPQSSVQIAP